MEWNFSCNFGRWQNSSFKLPVPILDNSSCAVRHNTRQFLKVVKIIVWDECTMTPHHALSAVDRLFRDLMGLDVQFGVHENRTAISETCLKNSSLWNSFKPFSFIRNMRIEPYEQDFASWLLHLDKGTLKNDCPLGEYIVEILEKCVVRESIVEEIFGSSVFDT
ncbi:ATP-dependent DNA helicase [Trichonephila inaurata madagascariensis]|uniref:ATP-dependent DNA helicase n=1 Tax=Trichonephila inaurata madagascariensis TaxID=2747483 RepID=A0A8X7BNH4_9ARAC|nr:ATP-dependent DNA helicase [Trichonephila inaurata madagascariensis]